jgi:coenzyme F420-0:L-glutamate ligase/coenzyme F420-1:gamma-L-glutamate ligase
VTLELLAVEGVAEIGPWDDLAAALEPALAAVPAAEGDVLAVTQKVVSKAEGRLVPVAERAEAVAASSAGVVARRGDLLIARTPHGFVCANAGVDASNVPAGLLSLLPEDPDASAERLREGLRARLSLSRLAVVVTDTFGRPWREGVVDVAIGCAGIAPLVDLRGTPDDRGRSLETTVVALADAVAAASGLVMTKRARVPAALVRGLDPTPDGAPPAPARALVRAPEDDLFLVAPLEAVAGSRASAAFGPGEVAPAGLERAVGAAAAADEEVLFATATSAAATRRLRAVLAEGSPAAGAWVVACLPAAGAEGEGPARRAGAAVGRLEVALHAEGLAWWWDPEAALEPAAVAGALGLDERWRPAGIVAVGPPGDGA